MVSVVNVLLVYVGFNRLMLERIAGPGAGSMVVQSPLNAHVL
jgi:hypothetical protein